MKKPKVNKSGKLPRPSINDYGYLNDVQGVIDIFAEKWPNHTMHEMASYIAGYFYRKHQANVAEIKRLRAIVAELSGEDDFYEVNEKYKEAVERAKSWLTLT
jgi:hypothetical protein